MLFRSLTAEREGGGFLTGATTVNGGAELLRWPEKRVLDAEGPGSRGSHQCAWQVTAISGLALVLAGTAPGDGTVQLLSLRAPAGEDAHGEAALLRPNANRGYSEMRRREGKREVPEWGGGVTFCCRNQGGRGG